MMSHVYNTKNNPISITEENVLSDTNFEASQSAIISETTNLILNFGKKLISRFNGLDKEVLNLKHIIIKNPQVEIQRFRKKVSDVENEVISVESDYNSIEHYGWRSNIDICGFLDSFPDQNLEER